jgi:hypothetical protein
MYSSRISRRIAFGLVANSEIILKHGSLKMPFKPGVARGAS